MESWSRPHGASPEIIAVLGPSPPVAAGIESAAIRPAPLPSRRGDDAAVDVDPPPNHHINAEDSRFSSARARDRRSSRAAREMIRPMNRHALLSRRRAAFALLACAVLAPGLGCQKDETVRGAGSIDIPAEDLKFKVTPKGKKAKS